MAKGDEKSKKDSSSNLKTEPTHVQTIVVGSSCAGLRAAIELQTINSALQILVLESEERSGGRAASGLHLVPDSGARKWAMRCSSKALASLKIRWERNWVDSDQVDWNHKEWAAVLPQWKLFSQQNLRIFEGVEESSVAVAVKTKCPVKSIRRLADSRNPIWELTTPTSVYLADQVIWSAGLMAFQNAYGKHESQEYLDANPDYSQISADFKAGLALDWEFGAETQFEDNFPVDSVWAIPVRHEGRLFLIFGVISENKVENKIEIRCLMNIENDSLAEPKLILALQKAIKRTIKNVIVSGVEGREKWIASNRILGSEYGIPWVFGVSRNDGLEFVGEETIGARKAGHSGLLASFESIRALNSLKTSSADYSVKDMAEVFEETPSENS